MQKMFLCNPFVLDNQTFALCADQKGFIRCEKGTKIKVISALYGRTDDKVCPYGNTNSRTCRSLTSQMKVKWSCNGYRTCHLYASDQIFGNPCSNVSKYLEVKYRCVKGPDACLKGNWIAFNCRNNNFVWKKNYQKIYEIKSKLTKYCLIF